MGYSGLLKARDMDVRQASAKCKMLNGKWQMRVLCLHTLHLMRRLAKAAEHDDYEWEICS